MTPLTEPRKASPDVFLELVTRLEVVLNSEEATWRRFKQVLRREEDELITLDPYVLERTTAEKDSIALEARLHGESRVELTRALATALGEDPGAARLSDLLAQVGDGARDLLDRSLRLRALVESTRALLAANAQFANRSLGRVQDTLRLLGQAIPEVETYGPGGANERSAGRGRLIRASI